MKGVTNWGGSEQVGRGSLVQDRGGRGDLTGEEGMGDMVRGGVHARVVKRYNVG